MLGFRRATCPRVSGQGPMMARARQRGYSVGATEPTGRPCRQRTLRCSQGSQGWKLKLVRQGPERWQWSGREQSRPKSLDIRRPIQGSDLETLVSHGLTRTLIEDPPEWDLASTWPYRLLIAAALLIPALLFGAVAWQDRGRVLRNAEQEAQQEAQQTVDIFRQHALNVFE